MLNIRKFLRGIGLIPKTASEIDSKGELEVIDSSGKLNYHNGSSVSPVVTEAHSATLTNKTIDADSNTISNIENADIKTGAAIDAAKIHDGSVSNTEFGYLNGVTSSIQTQLDSKFSNALNNDHIYVGNASNIATAVDTTAVGDVEADATNGLNIKSGVIVNADINASAGIAATKIHDGSVDNTEFGYLNGVTSSIQTQLDGKLTAAGSATLTNKTIDGDDNTVQDLALTSLKTVLGDANRFLVRNGSGVVVSNTKTVPTGDVVGTSDTQTLTNKTTDILTWDDQGSTPSNPSAGFYKTYFKTDGKLYRLNSAGVETEIGGSGGSVTQNEVWVQGGNGKGSTNNPIRRYTNTLVNVGSAITYADSATLGATFTINSDGYYAISMVEVDDANGSWIAGISRNSSELTTDINSIAAANRIAVAYGDGSGRYTNPNVTLWCTSGDVIRAHSQSQTYSSGSIPMFRIVKVSN